MVLVDRLLNERSCREDGASTLVLRVAQICTPVTQSTRVPPAAQSCSNDSYHRQQAHHIDIFRYNYKKRNTLPKDDTAIYTEINKVFKYTKFGTAQQTVGYTAFGESDDWLYDQGIISMSPEVGHEEDGFWPKKGKIMGIVERNYVRMRYLTLKAGCELEVLSFKRAYFCTSTVVKKAASKIKIPIIFQVI